MGNPSLHVTVESFSEYKFYLGPHTQAALQTTSQHQKQRNPLPLEAWYYLMRSKMQHVHPFSPGCLQADWYFVHP